MIDIKTLAILLLFGQFISVGFIVMVLWKQWKLLKLPVEPPSKELNNFRKLLFSLSAIILAGNVIPITTNVLTLFVETQRPAHVHFVSILYGVSVSVTAAVSAFTIWLLYRTALSSDHNNN